MAERVRIEMVRGNAPECPACGHWNALLDDFVYGVDPDGDPVRVEWLECRDCGYRVRWDQVTLVVKELDKPGMGARSTYHVVEEVDGDFKKRR